MRGEARESTSRKVTEAREDDEKREERRRQRKGCKDRVIKEEGRTDGKKRTKEECLLAGALCCLWVLSSK